MVMKTINFFVAAAALAAAALACSAGPQAAPTQVIEIPTAAPTAAGPTEIAAATPAAEGVGGGEAVIDSAIVLADYKKDPPTLTVRDPVSAATMFTLAAPGLAEGWPQWVAGGYVFYLDQPTQRMRRIGFDGSSTELPFVNSGGQFFEGDFLPSPDGARIAWGTSVFDPSGTAGDTHIQFKVANVDGSGKTVLLDQWLKDRSILPSPWQWSPDGRHLYFSNLPYGIGGYILFSGGPDLQQVDLATGAIKEILPDRGCLCAMSLSPDDTTVAYIPGIDPLRLVLRDVATGAERQTDLAAGHMQGGDIVWSPDGAALMFTLAISNPEAEAYSIVRVEASTLAQTTLIRDDARLLRTMAWPEAGVVWLNDKDGNAWQMDAVSGAVVQKSSGQPVVKTRR